jgi:hypothetical protein
MPRWVPKISRSILTVGIPRMLYAGLLSGNSTSMFFFRTAQEISLLPARFPFLSEVSLVWTLWEIIMDSTRSFSSDRVFTLRYEIKNNFWT